MSCGESSYNYVNRQIKKISEKQHNFIRLQDRVNANIFNKLDEINNKLLDIEQGNNDEVKKEIEKLATQINEVKSIISQNATENSVKFNDINNSILALQNKDKSQDTEIASIKEKNNTQDTEIASIKEKNNTQDTEIASIKEKNRTQDTEIASIKEKNNTQDTEIGNISNTLNSVEVKTLNVNTATYANVQQFIFQKKFVNIVGIFRTVHSQTEDSKLIQINNPYPSRLTHFVACDRNTGKALGCYINQSGVISMPLNYDGEKDIYLNVCYIS